MKTAGSGVRVRIRPMTRSDRRALAERLVTGAAVRLLDWPQSWQEDPVPYRHLIAGLDPEILSTTGDREVLLSVQRLLARGVYSASVENVLREMGEEAKALFFQNGGPVVYLKRLADAHVVGIGSIRWALAELRRQRSLKAIEKIANDLAAACRAGRDPGPQVRRLAELTDLNALDGR